MTLLIKSGATATFVAAPVARVVLGRAEPAPLAPGIPESRHQSMDSNLAVK